MQPIKFDGFNQTDINLEGVIEGLRYGYGPNHISALNDFAGIIYDYTAGYVAKSGAACLGKVLTEGRKQLRVACNTTEECLRAISYDVAVTVGDKNISSTATLDSLFSEAKGLVKSILDGKKYISNIHYSYSNDAMVYDEQIMAEDFEAGAKGGKVSKEMSEACFSLGQKERPDQILETENKREELNVIMGAILKAIKILKSTNEACFKYLVAKIESALIARYKQYLKPRSKKTPEVITDMTPLFINPLISINAYNARTYERIFSPNHDPFLKAGCGKTRRQRTYYKDQLYKLFNPIITAELNKVAKKLSQNVQLLIDSVWRWLGEIRYRKVEAV